MSARTAGGSSVESLGFRHRSSAGARLGLAGGLGAAAALVLGSTVGWTVGLFAAWLVTSAVFLSWTWTSVWPLSPDLTQRLSQREDPSRPLSDLLLVLVSVVALGAVAVVVMSAGSGSGGHGGSGKGLRVGLAVASVICAWATVHTVFMLKYARLYYRDTPGGISFNQDEQPAYRDFAYVAFTVGLTFQVSDTAIKDSRMRSLVLGHALVGYLFGAVIIAVTVNLLAGLSSGGG